MFYNDVDYHKSWNAPPLKKKKDNKKEKKKGY